MYAEIILSQRFPKHLGVFDYQIPDQLQKQIQLGQLVTIPFRKSEYEGVIITVKKTTNFTAHIKDIIKINQPEPILTLEQIELAHWLSEYYFVSLGTIIKMMLPPIPKSSRAKKEIKTLEPVSLPPLSMNINELINQFRRNKNGNYLFWPSSRAQQTQFMYWLLKKTKGQTLIIVPELSDIQPDLQYLSAKKQKEVAIIHSQLNKTQFFSAWRQIITGQAKIIIGTKLALFAPLSKPELIIFDQEENQGHKQSDQNPRFDGRAVVRQLAQLHNCRLLFSSHAPSVETFADASLTALRPEIIPSQGTIIDMRDERKSGNYTQLSEKLQTEITRTLKAGKKTFLFINKRGSASSVVCKDCGQVMTCKQCDLPLVYHANTNALYCHRCNVKYEVPPFCPNCSSTEFRFVGSGTQDVEQQAKKLWPTAKIVRLDIDSAREKATPASDLIIGTEYALKRLDWPSIGLVGVISADAHLYLPDFRSAERTWQMLTRMSFESTASFIIQTYNPENKLLENITRNQPEQFYARELDERKLMKYPPFTSLIKLIYQHRDKKTCLTNSQKMLTYLKTSPFKPLLLTPMTPYQNGKWRMYIIIKFQSPQQDALLHKILARIPEGWIIDRDPVNLL